MHWLFRILYWQEAKTCKPQPMKKELFFAASDKLVELLETKEEIIL